MWKQKSRLIPRLVRIHRSKGLNWKYKERRRHDCKAYISHSLDTMNWKHSHLSHFNKRVAKEIPQMKKVLIISTSKSIIPSTSYFS